MLPRLLHVHAALTFGGMGHVLDVHVHTGSTAGAMCLTRRVAGEPKAMDKPP